MTAPTTESTSRRTLTPRQRLWLELYLDGPNRIRYNARQAAIAAGYSRVSAHNQGSRNANNPVIKQLIDDRLEADIAALRRESTAKIEREARQAVLR